MKIDDIVMFVHKSTEKEMTSFVCWYVILMFASIFSAAGITAIVKNSAVPIMIEFTTVSVTMAIVSAVKLHKLVGKYK